MNGTAYNNSSRHAPSSPRGFWAWASLLLFQPVAFFRMLALPGHPRAFGAVITVILAVSISTLYQHQALPDEGQPNIGADFVAPPFEEGMDPESMFGVPQEQPLPTLTANETIATVDSSTNWEIATSTAAGLVMIWFVQAVLLCEVPLMRGYAPNFGTNLQIAIWASLPLALMAFLQILFVWTGGEIGAPGLSGFVNEWEIYRNSGTFVQQVVLSLSEQVTLFWLWSLLLLYWGARFTLNGQRFASFVVVAAWVTLATLLPVIVDEFRQINLDSVDSAETLPTEVQLFESETMESVDELTPEGDRP